MICRVLQWDYATGMGVLQWDYATGMGIKGARCVRNGNVSKAAHIEREGYVVNTKGVPCITGYKNLGDVSKAAHIEREGYVVNDKGVWCITGYKNLGDASKATHIKRES